MSQPELLIWTMPGDTHAAAVIVLLRQAGVSVAVLHGSDFPIVQDETHHLVGTNVTWTTRGRKTAAVDLSDVRVVWNRRYLPPAADASVFLDDDRGFAEHELRVFGDMRLYGCAPDAIWINNRAAQMMVRSKLWQLSTASSLGFRYPATMISNDRERVSEFIGGLPDGAIYKPLASKILQRGDRVIMHETARITQDDLPGPRNFSQTIGVYQERIERTADVRVFVVGAKLFAVAFNTEVLPPGLVDWRNTRQADYAARPIDCPEHVADFCQAVCQRGGIVTGSFDFMIDRDGQWVFLELNESGQFLFLEERVPTLSVLQCFTDYLLLRLDRPQLDRSLAASYSAVLASHAFGIEMHRINTMTRTYRAIETASGSELV